MAWINLASERWSQQVELDENELLDEEFEHISEVPTVLIPAALSGETDRLRANAVPSRLCGPRCLPIGLVRLRSRLYRARLLRLGAMPERLLRARQLTMCNNLPTCSAANT